MPIKVWDYTIEMKEVFVLRKEKMYLLLREEQREVHEFIQEQLRKRYIRLSKLPQTVPVFFVGRKDGKKYIIQNYRYLNEWTIKTIILCPLFQIL